MLHFVSCLSSSQYRQNACACLSQPNLSLGEALHPARNWTCPDGTGGLKTASSPVCFPPVCGMRQCMLDSGWCDRWSGSARRGPQMEGTLGHRARGVPHSPAAALVPAAFASIDACRCLQHAVIHMEQDLRALGELWTIRSDGLGNTRETHLVARQRCPPLSSSGRSPLRGWPRRLLRSRDREGRCQCLSPDKLAFASRRAVTIRR